MMHHYNHETLVVLVLFTVPFYHFSFSRYLEIAERHFSSDILVPFPDLGVLYSRDMNMIVATQTIHLSEGWVNDSLTT